MLLHRLFGNRMQIAIGEIEKLVLRHVSEYLRLLAVPSSEHQRIWRDFFETWPIIVSKSRPTALAVEMGQTLNMTLACASEESELILFCGEKRIIRK
jgi:hypothetical protein